MREPPANAGPERTRLAYQRTALSLVAGAALLARLTADDLGLVSLAGLVVTGPLALWAASQVPAGGRDGRPAAALSLGIVVLAVLVLAAVLLGRSGG